INLPAGGGAYSVDTSGGQTRLRRGSTVLFATPLNSIKSLTVIGSADNEAFDVSPAPAGGPVIKIDGGPLLVGPQPLPIGDVGGDTLNLDMSAAVGPVVVATIAGTATSASHQPVSFVGIEDINLIDSSALTDVQ